MIKLLFGRELEECERELLSILSPGDAGVRGIPEAAGYTAARDIAVQSDEADRLDSAGIFQPSRIFRRISQLAETAAKRMKKAMGIESADGKKLGGIIEQVKKAVREGKMATASEEQTRPVDEHSFEDAARWMRRALLKQSEANLRRIASGEADEAADAASSPTEETHGRGKMTQDEVQLMRPAAADTPQVTDMQKISDFFRRDSRRYDGGFKRY